MKTNFAAKIKPGPPRRENVKPEAMRQRRFVERESLEREAASAFAAGVVESVRARLPKSCPDDLAELALEAAAKTSRLISAEGPAIVEKLLSMAKAGDLQAAALISRHLIPTYTRVKLPPNQGIDQMCHNVLDAVASGDMPLETAEKVMGIAQKAADVALSGSLVARLESLKGQLERAREANMLPHSIELSSHRLVQLESI
jgi:hypothetical protein